ncbi:MAG: rhodanese-like domain-containing protein, partial [Methylococcaceae bacterium]
MKKYFYPLLIVQALAGHWSVAAESSTRESLATAATQSWVQAVSPAPQPYPYKSPKLDRTQFDALLARPEQLLLIDVRRPDELSKIGGFPAYLSIQAKDIIQYLAYIPRDRTIVTVSNHAGRAGAAADLLTQYGF